MKTNLNPILLILLVFTLSLSGCSKQEVIEVKAPPRDITTVQLPSVPPKYKGILPVYRPVPLYPGVAVRNKLEGWVAFQYDVDRDGSVVNAKIVDSSPPEVFDKLALSALSRYRYKPFIENGEAVEMKDMVISIQFEFGI